MESALEKNEREMSQRSKEFGVYLFILVMIGVMAGVLWFWNCLRTGGCW
jgi:hypothetical protein